MATAALRFDKTTRLERGLSALIQRSLTLLYLSFFGAGVTSAVISSIAEFEVFKAFYPKHASLGVLSFALLLVVVMEIAKLFLVVLGYRYRGEADLSGTRRMLALVRYALVGISVICMLFYTLYNLSNPEYDTQLAAATAELHAQRDRDVAQIDSSYATQKAVVARADEEDVTFWRKKMEFEMNNIVGRTWQGPEFRGNKERFDAARMKQAQDMASLESRRLAAVRAADSTTSAAVTAVAARLKTDAASQNSVLASALQVLNGSPNYSYKQYTALVILVSLLISLALEATMWAVFSEIAVTYGGAFAATLKANALTNEYSTLGDAAAAMQSIDTRQFHARVKMEREHIVSTVKDQLADIRSPHR